jgi:hypothetical protein
MTFGKKRVELGDETLSEIRRLKAKIKEAEANQEECFNRIRELCHPFPLPEDVEEIKEDVQELAQEYFRESDVYFLDNSHINKEYASFIFYIVNRVPFKNRFLFGSLSAFITDLCCECLPMQFDVSVLPEDYEDDERYSHVLENMKKATKL